MSTTEQGLFYYLKWRDRYRTEIPYTLETDLPAEYAHIPKSNIEFTEGRELTVQDVRSRLNTLALDVNGFEYIKHTTQMEEIDFHTPDVVEQRYFPECETILRQNMQDVDQVHFYHWQLRNSDHDPASQKSIDVQSPYGLVQPSQSVHVDQTTQAVVQRIKRELPEQADYLMRGRVRLVNLWRPLNGPVETWPLAFIDGRTISPSALIETQRIRRKYTGGSTFVLEEPGHEWSYLHRQDEDEVAIFKCFDSRTDVTQNAPHCSFEPLKAGPNAKPRRSIDVRAMVFTYPDESD